MTQQKLPISFQQKFSLGLILLTVLSGRQHPLNNIVNIDFDMLFFTLNLIVKVCTVPIVINSKYGCKPFMTKQCLFFWSPTSSFKYCSHLTCSRLSQKGSQTIMIWFSYHEFIKQFFNSATCSDATSTHELIYCVDFRHICYVIKVAKI